LVKSYPRLDIGHLLILLGPYSRIRYVPSSLSSVTFQLLQDVTDGISELVSENKFINRLHRLCTTLIGLCKPLIQAGVVTTTTVNTGVPEATIRPMDPNIGQLNFPDTNGHADDFLTSWNDDRMWTLFQSQPSLDWFNADILDPAWDLGLPK
jgi:hypothetical protein